MVKHTQTIRRLLPRNCFESVWPFCEVGAERVKTWSSKSSKWQRIESIASCLAPKYKDTIRKLHINISVLLRIISCTTQIDVEKLHTLASETRLLIATNSKRVSINYTLHPAKIYMFKVKNRNTAWSATLFLSNWSRQIVIGLLALYMKKP